MRMYNPKLRFGLWGGVSIYVDTLSTLLGSLLLLSSHAFTMTGSGVLEGAPKWLSTAYEGAQTLHIHVLWMCDARWGGLQPQ